MTICLTIENNKLLWTTTLYKLHLLGFRWRKTEHRLDEFKFLDGMLRLGAKGIAVNFKDKTVAWTTDPSKYYDYFIEVKK